MTRVAARARAIAATPAAISATAPVAAIAPHTPALWVLLHGERPIGAAFTNARDAVSSAMVSQQLSMDVGATLRDQWSETGRIEHDAYRVCAVEMEALNAALPRRTPGASSDG